MIAVNLIEDVSPKIHLNRLILSMDLDFQKCKFANKLVEYVPVGKKN